MFCDTFLYYSTQQMWLLYETADLKIVKAKRVQQYMLYVVGGSFAIIGSSCTPVTILTHSHHL